MSNLKDNWGNSPEWSLEENMSKKKKNWDSWVIYRRSSGFKEGQGEGRGKSNKII